MLPNNVDKSNSVSTSFSLNIHPFVTENCPCTKIVVEFGSKFAFTPELFEPENPAFLEYKETLQKVNA